MSTGKIVWHDLTVPDATKLVDFYSQVVGWSADPHDMGDYNDYNINAADGNCVAGLCHARGSNANVPPQWLMYISVDSVEESAAKVRELGGEVLDGPRAAGSHQFCVIRDPAGAVAALIEDTSGS